MPDIIQTISLQGVPLVSEQLKKVQTDSVATANAINQIGAEAGGGGATIQNFFVKTNQASDGMKAATAASLNFKNELRALKPVLGDLGVSFGGIGNFAKLAAASLPLFAASFAGKFLVDLTTFNEQLAVTKDRLDVITKGPGAFQQVAQDAQRLGVPIGTLATAVEQFATAWKQAAAATSTVKFVGDVPPGSLQSLKQAQALATALVAQFQALGVDGSKAIEEFTKQLGKTGTVTGDMVRALAQVSPRVAENFAKLFGFNDVDKFAAALDKVPIKLQQINLTVSAATNKWVEFANPKPIDDLRGALIELQKTFEGLKEVLAPVAAAISTELIKIATIITDTMRKNLGQIPQIVSSAFNPALLFGPLLSADIDFSPISQKFQALMDSINDIVQDKWDDIVQIFNDPEGIDLSGLIDSFTSAFQSILSAAQTFWQQMTNAAQQAKTSLEFAGPPSSNGGFFEFPQLARGGPVRGPGTATSDSIFARLSAGEFVMNAAATRHWGVQMLTALNNMRTPNLLPTSPIPRFAGGGAVQTASARAVHLHIGNQSFQLHGAADIVNRLEREASIRSLASTGIAQTWVGGRR